MLAGTMGMTMTNEQKRIKALEDRLATVERQLALCLHTCEILTDRLADKENIKLPVARRALA